MMSQARMNVAEMSNAQIMAELGLKGENSMRVSGDDLRRVLQKARDARDGDPTAKAQMQVESSNFLTALSAKQMAFDAVNKEIMDSDESKKARADAKKEMVADKQTLRDVGPQVGKVPEAPVDHATNERLTGQALAEYTENVQKQAKNLRDRAFEAEFAKKGREFNIKARDVGHLLRQQKQLRKYGVRPDTDKAHILNEYSNKLKKLRTIGLQKAANVHATQMAENQLNMLEQKIRNLESSGNADQITQAQRTEVEKIKQTISNLKKTAVALEVERLRKKQSIEDYDFGTKLDEAERDERRKQNDDQRQRKGESDDAYAMRILQDNGLDMDKMLSDMKKQEKAALDHAEIAQKAYKDDIKALKSEKKTLGAKAMIVGAAFDGSDIRNERQAVIDNIQSEQAKMKAVEKSLTSAKLQVTILEKNTAAVRAEFVKQVIQHQQQRLDAEAAKIENEKNRHAGRRFDNLAEVKNFMHDVAKENAASGRELELRANHEVINSQLAFQHSLKVAVGTATLKAIDTDSGSIENMKWGKDLWFKRHKVTREEINSVRETIEQDRDVRDAERRDLTLEVIDGPPELRKRDGESDADYNNRRKADFAENPGWKADPDAPGAKLRGGEYIKTIAEHRLAAGQTGAITEEQANARRRLEESQNKQRRIQQGNYEGISIRLQVHYQGSDLQGTPKKQELDNDVTKAKDRIAAAQAAVDDMRASKNKEYEKNLLGEIFQTRNDVLLPDSGADAQVINKPCHAECQQQVKALKETGQEIKNILQKGKNALTSDDIQRLKTLKDNFVALQTTPGTSTVGGQVFQENIRVLVHQDAVNEAASLNKLVNDMQLGETYRDQMEVARDAVQDKKDYIDANKQGVEDKKTKANQEFVKMRNSVQSNNEFLKEALRLQRDAQANMMRSQRKTTNSFWTKPMLRLKI